MGPVATAVLVGAVGFASGVLSAVAGVGGAVLTTPGIRALGATPLHAVGSTVPAIIPSAITGTIRYSRAGLINWRIALWVGATGMGSAFIGARIADHIEGGWLMVATACLVLYSSYSILRSAETGADASIPEAPDVASNPEAPIVTLVALGAGAGTVAGLLGVGGGIILVPAFTSILRLPVRITVATSLVSVALMSAASLVGHVSTGNVNWLYATPLAIGVIPGAWFGSRFTVATSERTMRRVVGSLLGLFGAIYLVTELIALI